MTSPSIPNTLQYPGTTNIFPIRGGREGAMRYPVQAGYTVLLLDEESKMFFIKKSDGTPMREFTYEEVEPQIQNASGIDTSKYATKEDFNILLAKLDRIEKAQNYRSNKFNKPRRNEYDGQRYAKPDVR